MTSRNTSPSSPPSEPFDFHPFDRLHAHPARRLRRQGRGPEHRHDRPLAGEDGCVGFSRGGRAVVSIITFDGQKILRVTEHGAPGRGLLDLTGFPFTDPRTLPSSPEVVTALGGLRLQPCQTTAVIEGKAVIPKELPIAIISSSEILSAQIEGNRALTDFARDPSDRWLARAAHWSPDQVHLFLRVVRVPDPPDEALTADDRGAAFVNGIELGQSECVPRPVEGKPLATEVPAFDLALASPDCERLRGGLTLGGVVAPFR